MTTFLSYGPIDFASAYSFPLEQLTAFRKITDEGALDVNLQIPAPPAERAVTDKKGFIIYGLALLICLPIVIYFATQKSDIRIVLNLFESKTDVEQFFLSAADHDTYDSLHKPQLKSGSGSGPGRDDFDDTEDGDDDEDPLYFNEDHKDSQDPWHYSKQSWWKFLLSVMATSVVCILVLSLLKCCPHAVIWVAIISIFGLLVTLIHVARLLSDTFDIKKYPTSPQFLIVMLCISFTVACFIFVFIRRHLIYIICFLYQEASRAIFPVSKLLLLTLLTIPLQLLVLSFSLFVALAIMAPSKFENGFKYDHTMGLCLFVDILITNWTMHLIGGFQRMVTAASVASRYFSGNLSNWRIFGTIFKHHLGTVAFGSAIQPVVAIIDQFVRFCSSYPTHECAYCLPLEIRLSPFLNKTAYVMSALHGQAYLKSGERAFNLLITYAPFFYALKMRGGVILLMMKLNLIFYCTGISYLLFSNSDDVWLPTILCLFANIVVVSIFIETVETAAHTLIISECENKFIKDDPSRRYQFVTKSMETIFAKSKEMYEHELKDRKKDFCCQAKCY